MTQTQTQTQTETLTSTLTLTLCEAGGVRAKVGRCCHRREVTMVGRCCHRREVLTGEPRGVRTILGKSCSGGEC